MHSNSLKVRATIKTLIKNRGYTYTDLAQVWNVSESSVRRIMSREDITLDRVNAVADWLGIKPSEIFLLSEQGENDAHHLTPEQDQYLAANPLGAYLYLRMMIGEPFHEFCTRTGFTEQELRPYLFQLEKIGLAELMSGDRLLCKFRGPFAWRKDGKMVNVFLPNFIKTVVEHFSKPQFLSEYPNDASVEYMVRPFEMYLTKASLKAYVSELRDVVKKYRRITNSEIATESVGNLVPVSGIILVGELNGWEAVMMKRPGQETV